MLPKTLFFLAWLGLAAPLDWHKLTRVSPTFYSTFAIIEKGKEQGPPQNLVIRTPLQINLSVRIRFFVFGLNVY